MKKKIIIPIAAVMVLLLVYFLFIRNGKFYYSGTIEATEVDLSSRLMTTIYQKHVDEGDSVKQDQELISLDCREFELQRDLAKKDYDRAKRLNAQGVMPKEKYDLLKYKNDNSELVASWCHVKSPIDGRVLYDYKEEGEMVSPGVKLLTLADLSSVWAYIYVEQETVAKLKVGMKVNGYLPELDMRKFSGTIVHINDEAEFTPKNVQTRKERTRLVYGVKVEFENKDDVLKPGMTIEVKDFK
jgi:membrane fusion protein YbhG